MDPMFRLLSLLTLLTSTAHGQDFSFPTSADDYLHWYPTAYYDHSGVDWNCGGITYSGHRGSDFGGGSFTGMDEGRDVVAAADGVVTATNDGEFDRCTTGDCYGGGGFGNYVYVEHGDGKTTIYAHLAQWSVVVSPGDTVSCGQQLGLMGSSGHSTGPHLHFEVREPSWSTSDPFDGSCSSPPSYWEDQGSHGDLPTLTCARPPCVAVDRLTCGDTWTGSNDGPGSAQLTWTYGCEPWVYTGPEIAFEVLTDLDEPVTLTVTGLTADLDLFALQDPACDGTGCVGASANSDVSDEALVFDATANHAAIAVIDGWEGAISPFTLSVECSGGLPTPSDTASTDTARTTDTAVTDTAATLDTGGTGGGGGGGQDTDVPPPGTAGALSEPTREPVSESRGCGCAHGHASPSWVVLLAAVAWRRRA